MAFSGKLFNLKEYFSIEETANRLTASLGENVSSADILDLACNSHMIISTIIEDEVFGILAVNKIMTDREILNARDDGSYDSILGGTRFVPLDQLDFKQEVLYRKGSIFKIPYGCYDLPMKWAEKLDVLWLFEQERGKSPKEWFCLDGPFLCNEDQLINVMRPFDETQIEWVIDTTLQRILRNKETKELITEDNYHSYFYPADSLGEVEFVFKRENIEKFEQSLLQNEDEINFEQSKMLMALVLKALKEKASKSWDQDDLSTYISENLKTYGLGKTKINKFFAQCNKIIKSKI